MSTPLFAALIYFSCDAFLFNLRCQTCYWGNVCAKEAFPFQLRFCIAWSCLCGWETWSLPQKTPDPALSRVMALLFMFFVCLAPCICLFVRPPRHTLSCVPSPNSIPDERKDSWCAYVPLTSVLLQLHGGGLMRKGVAVFIRIHSVMQFHGKSYFASRFQHIWGKTRQHVTEYTLHSFACCVLWNCAGSDLCFPSSWASLSVIVLNNTALLYPVPATLVVLYQAARNYSLKLVQLTG